MIRGIDLIPYTRCAFHTVYLVHGNSKGEAKEEADARIIARELEDIWKKGTWAQQGGIILNKA